MLTFRGLDGFNGTVGQVAYEQSGNDTIVNVDFDGGGTADFSILLENVDVSTLSSNDFIFGNVTGTSGDDSLNGNDGNNTIVGGYGSEINSDLFELIKAILSETDLPRLRLASVEPWDLPDKFFELFKNQRLMPHMHLPLQSGSDSVLKRMARRCKTADFKHLIEFARSEVPDFNVTTDVIVGFPGETEEEWQESMEFINYNEFQIAEHSEDSIPVVYKTGFKGLRSDL